MSDTEVEVDVITVETPEPKQLDPEKDVTTVETSELKHQVSDKITLNYFQIFVCLLELLQYNRHLSDSPEFWDITKATQACMEAEKTGVSVMSSITDIAAKLRPLIVPSRIPRQIDVGTSPINDLLGSLRSLVESNQ